MSNEEERIQHESFGQIRFSRVNSTGAEFYGSELTQNNYISLEISNSEMIRELTQDRYYNTSIPLVRLRMSSSQFAELITTMNVGSGVPCTIERLGIKKVDELPENESRKEFVHRKFADRMKMFGDNIRERQTKAKQLVKKKTLSKADQHELQMHLEWLTTEVERNIPFISECFQENMDEVVNEAKLEVENAIQHKINVLGFDALKEQHKSLDE